MKVIKQRLSLLIAASSLVLLAIITVSFMDIVMNRPFLGLPLPFVLLPEIIFLGPTKREYERLKTARLIVENKIMEAQDVKIELMVHGQNSVSEVFQGKDVTVSCFGILIDSRIIKYNIDKIRLKDVKIGYGFICLSYGTEEVTEEIRILHGRMVYQEIDRIASRFIYETGVAPEVSDDFDSVE